MTVTFEEVKSNQAVSQLFELIQVIWPEVFTSIIGEAQVAYMLENYQSITKIKTEIAAGVRYYFIALDGKTVGYAAYACQENQFFISKIYLLSDFRGKGISRQVFEWFEKIAREHEKPKLHLHVNRDNHQAIAVYQHFGFEIVKEVVTQIEAILMPDYWMEKVL
ncbi:hypothetical protein Hs30E_19700 [Lactococcus hodotermopsidis]|uniref:N-acetyltransferase domain-containing protein n=1 Tax=Pseudolactococcus hodotermopsidis TaxID=2709157 RepID=A0A6A0BDB1_9LACT|nr:GNAT family N-acetyltransferase [Lactococcus hodotermopsidis]GFH43419.1 hypothetical protein Hs30E_19700 [Lactococcus hodotermopsidis]